MEIKGLVVKHGCEFKSNDYLVATFGSLNNTFKALLLSLVLGLVVNHLLLILVKSAKGINRNVN